MPPSTLIDCRYRRSARRQGKTESAVCELLKKVTGIRNEDACRVTREACEACGASDPPTASSPNPVVASLLYHLCDDVLRQGGAPGLSATKAARLVIHAENCLASCHVEPVPLLSCDVVVCCDESTEQAERAISSVLAQEGVVTIVHLVDDGGGGDLARPLAASAIGVRGHSRPDDGQPPEAGRHRGRLADRGWVRDSGCAVANALRHRSAATTGQRLSQVPHIADSGHAPRIPAGHGWHRPGPRGF
jgi:hypothetical protein